MVLSRKFVEIKRKTRVRHKLGFCKKSLGERGEENQEKGELVESCNHQSKVRVGLTSSNLRLCNYVTEFNM